MDAEKLAMQCPNCGAKMADASISECVPGERWECRHCLLEGPTTALESILAAHDAMAKRVAELEYVSGYAADIACIRKTLDEVDAPHDPEEGASLEPKRIRLLAEQRDALRAKVEELQDLYGDCKRYTSELTDKLERAQASSYEEAARADAAERKRDELRDVIARVREACAELRACNSARTPVSDAVRFAASEIKAVLPREEG